MLSPHSVFFFFFSSDVSTNSHMIEASTCCLPLLNGSHTGTLTKGKLDTWVVSQIPEEGSRRYSDFPDPG